MWVSQWEVIQAGGLLSHRPVRPRGRGMGLGKSLKGPIRQGVQADPHLEKVGSNVGSWMLNFLLKGLEADLG